MKHANVDQIVGANANETYPNITLREDISLLDLAVSGLFISIIDFNSNILVHLGQYVIPLSYVLQLLKHAFNYQVYEIFEPLMEPISDLVSQTDGKQTSVLALLQILYEIEQCEKDRKLTQNAKAQPGNKGGKDNDKKKGGKDGSLRKKSPETGKIRLKKSKAIKDLIDAAKGARISSSKVSQVKIDSVMTDDESERSIEELLEDLCFLLLTDPQIVCIQRSSFDEIVRLFFLI